MRRVEAWLFAPGSPRRLAAVRIGLASLLAIRLSRGIYLKLAGQPPALFRPLSFMHVLSSMPSRHVVLVAQVIGIASALLAVIGLRARLTLPLAWGCAVLLNGMATSIGKVVHNDVLLILCLVPLLPARTSDVWSMDALFARHGQVSRDTRQSDSGIAYGWPLRTALVVATGAYFFTGLAKLAFSGPAWVLSGNLRWVLYAASDARGTPNLLALFVADRPWLAHLVALSTLVVELGFPVMLWRARAAWFLVPGAVALHAAIWVTLGLDYFPWAATVLILFVDWPLLVERARVRTRTRALREPVPA
ncbi:MAG TPA: hypothetical protein VGL18_14870 [Actinomycetota bacterium]